MAGLPRPAVALPLFFLLFGCALQDDYASRDYDVDRASRIFRTGYQDVVDVYIEDFRAPKLALAGLDGLANLDPALSVSYGDQLVTLNIDGRAASRFNTPHPDDTDGWGRLTATVIEELRHGSKPLEAAESEAVYEAVFGGMIDELDDFSRYAGRERARENRASRDGFGGIGVRIRVVDEGVKILSVMENTPADAAGLRALDLVTEINGESAVGLPQDGVVRRLRGPVRTTVTLTVVRPSVPGHLTFNLNRAHIVPQTVVYRAEGNIGYLRITGFNQSTAQSLREKILQAKREQGKTLKGLVLDLRSNPGGLLDQAVSVSDLFISRGRIVSTRGRHPDSYQFFDARKDDLAAGLPLAILINGNSASASEIVAAALQDAGRGVLIGSNSFGKGTVQTVLRLPNEGELTLTWARFHAPSGYSLHNRGVLPDICTSGEASDATGLLEQVRRGELRIDRATRSRAIDLHDTKGLAALRALCPVNDDDPEIDLQVALGLLRDSALYAQTLRGGPATAERTAH
jgi:carboxyl-terminal processing protease